MIIYINIIIKTKIVIDHSNREIITKPIFVNNIVLKKYIKEIINRRINNYLALPINKLVLSQNNYIKVMSQNWHGHWTEDTFKPKNLCNWQVPNWHPKWPDKHCVSTRFQVDNSGRFLPGIPYDKSTANTNFKGTWDLPKKIDRKTADELSAPSRKKYQQWQAHLARNSAACNNKNYNWTKIVK